MDETPHLVTHFMAVGAEKRLEDYCFLRNTYEKITGQEIQLNRILRMLGEDEISLNWRIDSSTIGRGRSRSLQDFDRWANSSVLKGSIAYERFRELEQGGSKYPNLSTIPSSSRRIQDIRERRQRLSEQRDFPSGSAVGGRAPSASRLQALAEYESSLADLETKRRQAEENRLKTLRNEDKESTERNRSKYRTIFEDEKDSYSKSKQDEDDFSNRRRKSSNLHEDQTKTGKQNREEDKFDKQRNSSLKYGKDKTSDIELIDFIVRCQRIPSSNTTENANDASVRLLCKWASPSSSSEIDYFTIERQLGQSGKWLPIGEQIDKLENQTQLDILPSTDDNQDNNTNIPSYFRLKAHLQNGQTFTSKTTDGIFLNLFQEKNIIVPDVEILSPSSVQLTWKDAENENIKEENEDQRKQSASNIYDIEKKEEQQPEWEKVLEVPLSQRSARIDSLTDATQCQFRLVPSISEFEETTQGDTSIEDKRKASIKSDRSKIASSENEFASEEADQSATRTKSISSENDLQTANTAKSDRSKTASSENEQESEEAAQSTTRTKSISSENDLQTVNATKSDRSKTASSENEQESTEPTKLENEDESDVLTVENVNEWLSSLHVVPTSPTTVDIDISEEGFQDYDSYKIEYTTADRPDQWKQMSNLTQDDPHLTLDKLKQGTAYKFRFTPITSDTKNEINPSQFSLTLDVQMPSARKGRFDKDESETPVSTPPQFSIQKIDSTSVRIEAVIPDEQPATFEDIYDIYSKKDKEEEEEDWTKVGTIDKEHLSTTVEDLEENTVYAFKIDNITSPSDDNESITVQELKFDTTPVKKYDPSIFLEKIEQSLENVVNGVMQAAAGHQTIEEPVNKSLNEVIKEVFNDKNLVPNEEFGFDTLALNNDLQLYRGPKQMMLKELEVNETSHLSQHEGEIIIHNYRTAQQSVLVREENGNTRVGNIDGDIIIRNVVSDVILKNERTNHQLGMNIVGQAFLRGVQGTLIASKFKGIIVVKNVNKP